MVIVKKIHCFLTFTVVGIIAFTGSIEINAQSFDEYKKRAQSDFMQYKIEKEREFNDYRDKVNAEFANYMRQAWGEYKSEPAVPVPDSPEPPAPVVKPPKTEPSKDPIPFIDVVPAPKPVEPPQPIVPLPAPEPEKPSTPMFSFDYYGQKCEIPLEDRHRFTLSGVSENNVADAWQTLSSGIYLPVIAKCLDYRDKLRLGDWGYVRFVEKLTNAYFPTSRRNEARLMEMYILTQSGYKVRIARADDRLVVLLPSKDNIYQYSFLTINGINYYVLEPDLRNATLSVFNREFPKEQFFSLRINELPALPYDKASSRQFQSKFDKETATDISVNKNLIAFFNDYPLSNNWDIYSTASLSEKTKQQLYPALKEAIAGKDTRTAANILLHFVQTAFDYATDGKQFGYERPLFGDETFYYPYSDCEDRAILFSILVRELLGLDVVLLHYPGHLATAVCFGNNDVVGDYLTIDGKRYIVCDPTYINSNVGDAMPEYKRASAQVVKIR